MVNGEVPRHGRGWSVGIPPPVCPPGKQAGMSATALRDHAKEILAAIVEDLGDQAIHCARQSLAEEDACRER